MTYIFDHKKQNVSILKKLFCNDVAEHINSYVADREAIWARNNYKNVMRELKAVSQAYPILYSTLYCIAAVKDCMEEMERKLRSLIHFEMEEKFWGDKPDNVLHIRDNSFPSMDEISKTKSNCLDEMYNRHTDSLFKVEDIGYFVHCPYYAEEDEEWVEQQKEFERSVVMSNYKKNRLDRHTKRVLQQIDIWKGDDSDEE